MIGTSFGEWIFIRISIAFFRYTFLVYIFLLVGFYAIDKDQIWTKLATKCVFTLLMLESLYAFLIYFPFAKRLSRAAQHPEPLSSQDRRSLFQQCVKNIKNAEVYLQGWFLGSDITEIRHDNVVEFILWAFFDLDTDAKSLNRTSEGRAILTEIDEYIRFFETSCGYKLEPGRGTAKSLRLTFDDVQHVYRSLLWYIIMFFVDQVTHIMMWYNGFSYYTRGSWQIVKTFPPRPQELLLSSLKSPVPELGYWYTEHRDETKLPVIFLHGLGIGLLTYANFLAALASRNRHGKNGGIGIIAVELLPVSFRITGPPPRKAEFLEQVTKILAYHDWKLFTLASHSYGSVLASQVLRHPTLRDQVASVMSIDPVSIMLHLPDIAYNFTRRRPRKANEWQLWYFASMDPGVAHCLGRHFFWREGIIWTDELLHWTDQRGTQRQRRVTVSLAGKDIIVDSTAVAGYLAAVASDAATAQVSSNGISRGVKILQFAKLDHAQVFDHATDYMLIIEQLLLDQSDAQDTTQ